MAYETKHVYQQNNNAAACDHTQQHCYFADVADEMKHVDQQNSNAAVCDHTQQHCYFAEKAYETKHVYQQNMKPNVFISKIAMLLYV